jgi:hypothetical protein
VAKSHAEGVQRALRSPKEADAALRLATLPHGFQGIEDLKTNLETILIVSAEAKMCETIVGQVKADLVNTPQPPTSRAKCRWVSCRKNMGTTQRTQSYRMQGMYA